MSMESIFLDLFCNHVVDKLVSNPHPSPYPNRYPSFYPDYSFQYHHFVDFPDPLTSMTHIVMKDEHLSETCSWNEEQGTIFTDMCVYSLTFVPPTFCAM